MDNLFLEPSWINYNLPASLTARERASVDFEGWVSSVVLSADEDEFFFRMLSIENGLASIILSPSMYLIICGTDSRLRNCFAFLG